MVSARAGHRCVNRFFEWFASAGWSGVGAMMLAAPASALVWPAPRAALSIPPDVLGFVLFVCGAGRLGALWVNGTWPHSAKARAAGAGVCGLASVLMLVTLMTSAAKGLPDPFGIPMLFGLVVGEAISCFRAAADDRNR